MLNILCCCTVRMWWKQMPDWLISSCLRQLQHATTDFGALNLWDWCKIPSIHVNLGRQTVLYEFYFDIDILFESWSVINTFMKIYRDRKVEVMLWVPKRVPIQFSMENQGVFLIVLSICKYPLIFSLKIRQSPNYIPASVLLK